jgi:hypothetical protein
MDKHKTVIGYMCMSDFDFELGKAVVEIYPTEKSAWEHRECVDECGMVMVEVRMKEVTYYPPPNYED